MTAHRLWLEPEHFPILDALRDAVGGHPLVAATLARRGLADPDRARAFLDPDVYTPSPAHDLPDLERGLARLREAMEGRERIWIWGDFDVDGQTSTALLYEELRNLGADVHYYLPRRDEGHGLHLPALERILSQGAQLLLTCDTGVTAHEEIAFCRGRSVDVIVTDHHDLPAVLPEAEAVINPKRLPSHHLLHELTGVGCAYKLMEALHEELGCPERSASALDLVALGLVGDVAQVMGDVRYLIQRGLRVLRRAERPGLRALLEVAELSPLGLDEGHIGYLLAPRLNALGRLDDATAAVELLTTSDATRARIIATTLEGLNDQRKLMVKQVLDAAEAQIARDPSQLQGSALVLAGRHWPGGIIGIVAGRLAERYACPALLISIGDDDIGHGSARSVPGCDIHAAIAAQRDLLHRFGGHPMAAGFSLDAARIPEFRQALLRSVATIMAAQPYRRELAVDAYVTMREITPDLAGELGRLAPFGPGNPPPCLVLRNVSLLSHAILGRTEEHRRLTIADAEGETCTVLQWHGADLPLPQGRFDLAFALRASDFQGRPEMQLEWIDARELEAEKVAVAAPEMEVIDYRQVANAESVLRGLLAGDEERKSLQLWCEGLLSPPVGARDRTHLEAAPALILWTIPPGPEVLHTALRAVSPERIYLFAINPGLDAPAEFLRRLAGLVKHALAHRGGRAEIAALAAATAQREAAVRAGLRWLAAKGQITIAAEDDVWQLFPGIGQPSPDLPVTESLLRSLLEETAAYRSYYLRADARSLGRR